MNPIQLEQRQTELDSIALASYQPLRVAKLQEFRQRRREAATPYGKHLLQSAAAVFEAELVGWLTATSKASVGKDLAAARLIGKLPAAQVALITSRVIIDRVSDQTKLVSMASAIGTAIENELAAVAIDDSQPKLWRHISKMFNSSVDLEFRSEVVRSMATRRNIETIKLSMELRIRIGIILLELFVHSTGFVEFKTVRQRMKTITVVTATRAMSEWLRAKSEDLTKYIIPDIIPHVVPPKPWEHMFSGGYAVPGRRKPKLVKDSAMRGKQVPEVSAQVMQAVSALQMTRWRINRRVLAVANACRKAELTVGKLVMGGLIPLPQRPANFDELPDEDKGRIVTNINVIERENHAILAQHLQTERLLHLAGVMSRDVFYFSHNLDFRGRVYSIPNYLQPQGHDLAKGLLEFAEGKKVTAECGAYWLCVHLANRMGQDKASLQERVLWVLKQKARIVRVAADPLSDRWWTEAPHPWCALAAIFEVAEYFAKGEVISHVPVMLDATCSGLQNYSAMLRDPVGGKAVNLLPSDRPQDLYRDVAELTASKLQAIIAADD